MNLSKFYICCSLIFALSFSLLSAGCGKAPMNGHLDGQWQVMSVEPEAPEIIFQNRLYMCFYMHTCQLTEYGSGIWTSGNMKYEKGKSLWLDFPDLSSSTVAPAKLKQFGIYRNPVSFTVDYIDNKKMILRNDDAIVTLRKF